MKIKEVVTSSEEKEFNQVHVMMNRGNSEWVQPLTDDINKVFDPKRNKKFKVGEAIRWVLLDDSGSPMGRIAAFSDPKYINKGDKIKPGCIGFFDCVNDQLAADLLFNTAAEWLKEKGYQGMDGPINFGERNNWWGLLTEGFHEPVYGMNYNPPYYQALFEKYGFQVFYNQICYQLDVLQDVPHQLEQKFYDAHSRYSNDTEYSVRHYERSKLVKYANDFAEVYNKAWAQHEGNKAMDPRVAIKLFKTLDPIIDPKIVFFAYHHERPVAMWLNIPDLNKVTKSFHGKFGLINKLRLVANLRFRGSTRMIGLVFGVVPEYQGKGIDYFMIVETEKMIKSRTRYLELEMQWLGDFNPKIQNIAKNLTAEKSRNLVTYRYLFDRTAPFERHPIFH